MSIHSVAGRIAGPYARALFEVSVQKNIMHQITGDFQNLDTFLNENSEWMDYLTNPLLSQSVKGDLLTKTLQSQVTTETFQFLQLLLQKDRMEVLPAILTQYLELVYETASIKTIEVVTAFPFTPSQKERLIQKLKELTAAQEIRLLIQLDPTLIGGFLMKTNSKILDFTVKHRFQKLAQELEIEGLR